MKPVPNDEMHRAECFQVGLSYAGQELVQESQEGLQKKHSVVGCLELDTDRLSAVCGRSISKLSMTIPSPAF